jgi:ParB/RepB/Spo0J family partition protein
MNGAQFAGDVRTIPVEQIEASPDNPRGTVAIDQSFERLVNSVQEVGILVPIVVREVGKDKYQLVDGERRFLAAKQLRLKKGIPAHVITSKVEDTVLRKYMFHLHMTREQWEPLAQCNALAEMYPELEDGIPLREKNSWAKRIKTETWMDERTAKDRVHVLAWPKKLKDKIQTFDSKNSDRDVYSYVLAIEASIVEPHLKASKDYKSGSNGVDTKANQIRAALLDKTLAGIEKGHITNRDQIRELEPLLKAELSGDDSKVAAKILDNLVKRADYFYDDAASEVEQKLPELVSEKPPKPQRLLGSIRTLTETLDIYKPEYIDLNTKGPAKQRAIRVEIKNALASLVKAANKLRSAL